MAYNEKLADILRQTIATSKPIEEKQMMGGLTFMVDGKMCLGIVKDDLMARIDPKKDEEALRKPNARPMDFTGRPMKGYIFVNEQGWSDPKQLDYWINLALDFNDRAQSSKKKK